MDGTMIFGLGCLGLSLVIWLGLMVPDWLAARRARR
jgi:hypothetical protein